MTTMEGHDMPDEHTSLTDTDLAEIRDRSNIALSEDENPEADEVYASAIDVPYLLAEVDRLRAELLEAEENHEKWVKFVRPELDKLRSDRDLVNSEISTRCSGISAWPCPTAIARGIGN